MGTVREHYLRATLDQILTLTPDGTTQWEAAGSKMNLNEHAPEAVFRIKAPDAPKDKDWVLKFTDRELLCRFASLPEQNQLLLLLCIRKAMDEYHTTFVQLNVPWSSGGKERVVKIAQYSEVSSSAENPIFFGQGNLNLTMA